MSFAIRQTYKPRALVNNNDDTESSVYDPEEAQRIITAVKHFTQRSHSIMTPAELREALRKSSINPDVNPSVRDSVESLIKSFKESETNHNAAVKNAVNNMHGFSNASTSGFNTNVFKNLLDEELKRELSKVSSESKDSSSSSSSSSSSNNLASGGVQQTVEEEEEEEDASTGSKTEKETDEEYQKRLEAAKNRRMLSIGYPSRASMLRGWVNRTTGSSGGIRRTAHGMVDAF